MNNMEQLNAYREAHIQLMREQVTFLKHSVEVNTANLAIIKEVAALLSGLKRALSHVEPQPTRQSTRLAKKAKTIYNKR